MVDSSMVLCASPTRRARTCRPSGSAGARIPCRRFRNTPRVRISSFCRRRIASRRWKNQSRFSAWTRSRKGSLFHQVQAEFFRALQKKKLAITEEHMAQVLSVLDETLTRIAAEYYEKACAGDRPRLAGRGRVACAPIFASGSIGSRRIPTGNRGCSSSRSVCPDNPVMILKACRTR